jgi:phosphoglycerate dehydrogenase-like enzyme
MSNRSVVALVLPPATSSFMFRESDLQRLRAMAEVVGPIDVRERAADRSLLGAARVAITGWGTPAIDAGLLAAAPNLRLIAHSAGSVKYLVNEAVYDRGIRVSTAAGANAVPVAQFTVAMMVMMLKQVPWLSQEFTRNPAYAYDNPRHAIVRELHDMKVGIVAASRIGRLVIGMLKGFHGLDILLYDPYVTAEQAREMGATLASLEDVFRCEVVSIHAPNIPATQKMVNAKLLRLLPDHAVLINTSRGALVDEDALVAEVRRRPLYVALDVTDPEPPRAESPLRTEPNIILTPHIAGAMNQARREMGALAIDETIRFLRGERLQYEVTRQMLPTQA